MAYKKKLNVLEQKFTIHRFEPSASIPDEIIKSKYFWIGKTDEELSVVCESGISLRSLSSNAGWSVIKIAGPLDFNLVGILAEITSVLAKAGISIFTLSTYNTDYILVKKNKLPEAIEALKNEGYVFEK